jgi:hypothetical protein
MLIAEIVEKNRNAGQHYFDRDTLKFFGQRISSFKVLTSPKGNIFIYAWSNPPWSQTKLYKLSVAQFNVVNGHCEPIKFSTVQELKEYVRQN